MPLSDAERAELRERAEECGEGNWANPRELAFHFSMMGNRDREFIAAANPTTVLALLDELADKDAKYQELFDTTVDTEVFLDQCSRYKKRLDDKDKKLDAVRELHYQDEHSTGLCWTCDDTWPCSTMKIVGTSEGES